MSQPLEISVPIFWSRYLPASAGAEIAMQLEASGVVDSMTIYDQLTFLTPHSLWNPDETPMAKVLPDVDSFGDPFAVMGNWLASAPTLGTSIGVDAVRRGPAELWQSMMTLALFTEGKAVFQMGAGENKQCRPFGWKRKEGIGRLEDHLRAYRAFWDTEGPIEMEGNFWSFKDAWLGEAKQYRPRVWTMGGGPKLLDLATTYSDGFTTIAPQVWTSADHAGEEIARMKADLAQKGRDPEQFTFGIWAATMIHDDMSVIDHALDHNKVIRWLSASIGRINQRDWAKEGIEPVWPEDWHYAIRMFPVSVGAEEANRIADAVTPEMSRKAWMLGTPQECADQVQEYIDAGVSWINLVDLLPLALDPEQAPEALRRQIEFCRILKERNPHLERPVVASAAA